MSQPALVSHTGSLSGAPSNGAIVAPSLQELLNTGFSNTYQATASARPTISALEGSPFTIPLVTITKVRMIAMQVRSGSLTILLTSTAGTDQAILASGLFLMNTPNAGTEITSIKVFGTADLEYVIAGDVT